MLGLVASASVDSTSVFRYLQMSAASRDCLRRKYANEWIAIQEKGHLFTFTFQLYRLSRRIIISCRGNRNIAAFTSPASLKQVSVLREAHREIPGLLRSSLGSWTRKGVSSYQVNKMLNFSVFYYAHKQKFYTYFPCVVYWKRCSYSLQTHTIHFA